MKKNNNREILSLVLITTFVLLTIPSHFVQANSPPPPSEIRLYFDLDHYKWRDLIGIQLIGCDNETCESPILLQQFGECSDKECIKDTPIFNNEGYDLQCADYRCYSRVYPDHGGLDFKLIIQFHDRVFTSAVNKSLPSKYGETQYWSVDIQNNSLYLQSIEPGQVKYPMSTSLFPNGVFWISILIEVIISGIYFLIFHKLNFAILLKQIMIVLLVNLLTLPVVWFLFPSLGFFITVSEIKVGFLVLGLSFLYSILLIKLFNPKTIRRGQYIVLGILSIPITMIFFIVFVIAVSNIDGRIIAQGLSSHIIIILSEIFAVVVEAVLITKLSNQVVTKKHAWILSLVMNTVSFLVGQLLHF